MEHLMPKNTDIEKVCYELPRHIVKLVEAYAEFSNHKKEDVIAHYLSLMVNNPAFREWIKSKRNNKRLIKDIFGGEIEGDISSAFEELAITLEEI